jgi:cobyrinic acid a,c-diamide synthase
VLVAAPASGQGKTTVACALARLHARQGARVRAFKCGPDFLDPQWLELASGAPVDSLDLWINGEADCAARLAAAADEADLVIVEGVMGLYDGEPSAADLARRFGLPVLAVIDAGAMAGTFGALVHGLRHWQAAERGPLPWAGVLANRVASERHAQMLQAVLAPDDGWGGHLPRQAALPERHLGLTAAGELDDALARLDAAADALAATPLGQRPLADGTCWPRWLAPDVPQRQLQPLPQMLAGRHIAVARDAAFGFIYPANLAVLRDLGAQLTFFSPLAGDALPACDALWLPGGYPELHAERLAQRQDLRAQIAAHLGAGRPVWAECGGMMALADTLVDGQGRAHALWGLLPGTATLGRRVAALGPHRWLLGDQELRGHSFHWSRFETPLAPVAATEPARGVAAGAGEPIYQVGALRASWFHPWFASSPEAAARLFLADPVVGSALEG